MIKFLLNIIPYFQEMNNQRIKSVKIEFSVDLTSFLSVFELTYDVEFAEVVMFDVDSWRSKRIKFEAVRPP